MWMYQNLGVIPGGFYHFTPGIRVSLESSMGAKTSIIINVTMFIMIMILLICNLRDLLFLIFFNILYRCLLWLHLEDISTFRKHLDHPKSMTFDSWSTSEHLRHTISTHNLVVETIYIFCIMAGSNWLDKKFITDYHPKLVLKLFLL